jgi:guanine deaminase
MNHQEYLCRAIELARHNVVESQGGPFGCIIVQNGKIVSEAVNQVTTLNDPTAHAEIQAIRNACRDLKTFMLQDCILYTSCEPCPMCLSAIYWARIPEVYFCNSKEIAAQYGFDDQFIYDEIGSSSDLRKIKMQKLSTDESTAAFQLWKASAQKILY